MKKALITGLAGILLAGLSLNGQAQKREYIPGNVNGVEYTRTTEKDFSKYKLEEQCLFNNCYNFWDYSPKANELSFSVSKIEENISVLEVGGNVTILSKRYTPKKISDITDVMDCITENSYNKLRKKVKNKEYFGFSADITDKDLKLKLPEIKINGVPYIVLKVIEDSEETTNKLPIYLIPKTKGTKIIVPNKSFKNGNYEAQARIVCDENGGIYQPILNNLNLQDRIENEIQEEWQGNTEETDYMLYREEQERKDLENQTRNKEPCDYILQEGDTGFWSIAGKTLGDEKRYIEIQNLNPDLKSKNLKVGQKILIPCK